MKNTKWFGLLLSAQLMAATAESPLLSLFDLNERMIQEFANGKRGDWVVECPEGAALPLKIALKGELLALEPAEAPLYLKLLKTCYVRYEGPDNFLFSADLQTWKSFTEFFTGELKAAVEIENGGPVAGLQFELNQRKAL